MKTSTLLKKIVTTFMTFIILLIMILTIAKICQFIASLFTELLFLEKSQDMYIPRYNASKQNYGKHQRHSHMISI